MWRPQNKSALPSPEDVKHAKNAIHELEDALKDALVVLEQAQSRVQALTKELYERKAWIAPVRKLPSELLSEIFIFGSEMEHLAPVTITEVSKLWRAVVLATPRAWSLIYVSAPEHENHLNQYVSTFVERSNPCLLHIWDPDGLDYETDSDESDDEAPVNKVMTLLLPSLSRICCLSIDGRQLTALSEECMPNLARLMIVGLARDIPPFSNIPSFSINWGQFPRLRSIWSTRCTWPNSISLTSFPPLQELAIQTDCGPTWLEAVKNCSATLQALVLVDQLEWTRSVTIIFPRLLSLTLSDQTGHLEPQYWCISMVTPGLISYDEFSQSTSPSTLLHGDVGSVTHLKRNYLPDLAPFISLRVLRLSPTYNSSSLALAGGLAEQLRQDINTSPALELAEFRLLSTEEGPELESTKRDIIEQIKSARPGIEVSFTRRFSPMPGSMEENSCKPGMPCSQELV